MSSGILWLLLIAIGIAAVIGIGYFSKRKLTSGREPIEMAANHARVSDQVSFEALRDVLNAIGRAYSLDPKFLRPEDSLDNLLRADSWTLGAGAEKLNQWLVENGLDEQPTSAKTVLDLAQLVDDSRRRVGCPAGPGQSA